MRLLGAIILIGIVWVGSVWGGDTEKPAEISFKEALEKVWKHHPDLKSLALRRQAVVSRAWQARVLPNPELEASLEDFYGSGEFGGLRASEFTLEISQTLPLFGKRKQRQAVVLFEKEIWDSEEARLRLELFQETARLYTEALYAQKKLALYEELVRFSEKLAEIAEIKFRAGRVPETEKIRARIVVSRIRMKQIQAREAYQAALRQLALLWGEAPSKNFLLAGRFQYIPLSPENLKLKEHPELARLEKERLWIEKKLALTRTEALPDITLSAGVRWFNENDERAYLFSVSLPLPLFDRKQGEREALWRELSAVRLRKRSRWLELQRNLEAVKGEIRVVLEEVRTLEQDLLPRAEEIYRRYLEGYRYGKMGFLQVLDTQRTLFDLRLRLLEAYKQYHLLRAKALYLTGRIETQFF